MKPNGIGAKILYFPLTKIIIGLFVLGIVLYAGQTITHKILPSFVHDEDLRNLIDGIIAAVLALLAYIHLFRFYENRSITELAINGLLKNLALGILIGAMLQTLTIGVIYIYGGYRVESINPLYYLLPPLTMGITSAVIEEIMMRGIIFRILEEKLGSYLALVLSALLFGFLHLTNPNSSLIVALGLAIQAGLLLGVAYMYSRSLWLPIAIHFAWNFTQSAVFGARVSGITLSKTLITSTISGHLLITGGAFGPEGSVQATLFSLILTTFLFLVCRKKGHIISRTRKKI